MACRDNNRNPYQIGHIYEMYSSQFKILKFTSNGGAVLVQDIKRPESDSFHFYLCNNWVHIKSDVPKNNREALSLLEME